MATESSVDQERLEAFMGKVGGNISGWSSVILAYLGDRLGLFKDLSRHGPATSTELARRASVNERYTREWLGGMAAAGYLTYDAATMRFTLPPEQALVLADEGGPAFMGGYFQALKGLGGPLDQLHDVFMNGGGIPHAAYDDDWWVGMERITAVGYDNRLVQHWIPGMPAVQQLLEQGASVADIGCGHGRATIVLAKAFPNSRFVGFDAFPPAVARATRKAEEAGVADRVRFEVREVAEGLPGHYDVITTFDVIHDAAHPLALLRTIRQALRSGGRYICMEANCSHNLEENLTPLGTALHAFSITYCMTTSLGIGGEGLGTLGMPPKKLEELCHAAGFSSVRIVDDYDDIVYEVMP
ncbi:MAG: methyltransferase domain-containing protein [Chloroflexota bacterium]|nr:methyltransferase domain-containing protein [Chloroflexota bacterium]